MSLFKGTFIFCLFCLLMPFGGTAQADDTLRVMTYNLLNYRNNTIPGCTNTNNNPTTKENALKLIIDHTLPDILICNEIYANSSLPTFRILQNSMNQSGRTNYDFTNLQIGQNQINNTSSTANMIYFNTNKLELKGSTYIEQDVFGGFLVRVIDLYTLYYKDPNLSVHQDTTFFYIFAAHLKAGSGTTDQLQRARATQAVMALMDSANASGNYMMAGDLNLYRSSETAYQNMLNYYDTSLRFYDPINVPGSWTNNSPYAIIHTQSTRSTSGCGASGGMDDRFDFILLSDELMNGTDSAKYIQNSYVALGQDGLHFNQAIDAGTNNSVPSNVLQALVDVSDHLPVMLDLEVNLPNTTGIKTIEPQSKISFNNPVEDRLELKLINGSAIESIEILGISGRQLRQFHLNGNRSYSIDISDLSGGLYFIKVIENQGRTYLQKLIKN